MLFSSINIDDGMQCHVTSCYFDDTQETECKRKENKKNRDKNANANSDAN